MGERYKALATIKGHRTNEERAARADAEANLFKYPALTSTPPTWLDGLAVQEWNRITPLIQKEIPISELDVAALASYCQAYSDVQQAQAAIDKDGLTVLTSVGSVKANPAVKVKRDATAQLMKLSDALGLTVYSRIKMQLKGDDTKAADPFQKLVQNS